MIATARYRGPRANWSFDQYINKHQQAHNELQELGEPMLDTKKVDNFLAGISDPTLKTAKEVAIGDMSKNTDFQACQQY